MNLSDLSSGQISVSSALSDEEPATYPRFPTRNVRTVDKWKFHFVPTDTKNVDTGEPLGLGPTEQTKPKDVTVPNAFDLSPAALNQERCAGKNENCCERALGATGDETCWKPTHAEILELDIDEEQQSTRGTYEDCCGFDSQGHPLELRHARGTGIYEAEIGGHVTMLKFHACLFKCEVFVDGIPVASFVSGFAPKEVPIGEFRIKSKKIAVRADNTFNYQTTPLHQRKYDWFQAGGLVRPVEAHSGNFIIIKNVRIKPYASGKTKDPYSSSGDMNGITPVGKIARGPNGEPLPPSLQRPVVDSIKVTLLLDKWDANYSVKIGWQDRCIGSQIIDLHGTGRNKVRGKLENYPPSEDRSIPVGIEEKELEGGFQYEHLQMMPENGYSYIAKSEGYSSVQFDVPVPDATLWTLDMPHLHFFSVQIFNSAWDMMDCFTTRFGLRTFETHNNGTLYLNNQPVKLQGVNRHDMDPSGTGPAMSDANILKDVRMIKATGANFVRGAHYPQDQRFLDLCDEFGLLVWEESLGWQNSVKDYANPTFMGQVMDNTKRMILTSYNHPSVVIWSFFNEGDTQSPQSRPIFVRMISLIKRMDRSRQVTWASSARLQDINLDLADIISFNSYEGWYPTQHPVDKRTLQEIPEIWDFSASYIAHHYPQKALICSETGAGALFGMHGPSDGLKWTEEVQSLILQVHTLAILRHEKIQGIAIWQFSDALVDTNEQDGLTRPRGLNNKGLLSLHRKPKTGYFAIRTIFKGEYFGLVLPESDTQKFRDVIRVSG